MIPTTEIVILKLKNPEISLEGDSETATVWKETLTTILAQDGAQRLYWGTAVEDPSLVRMFVNWDSLDHHKKFMASKSYDTFVAKVLTIVTEIVLLAHAELTPLPKPARDSFTSPAAELLTVFFPPSYTEVQQAKVAGNMAKLVEAVAAAKVEGFRAAAAGWGLEDDIPNLKKPGVKGKAFFFFIGWGTVEDHLEFRNTDLFKENIHLLRDSEDMQEFLNMHFHGKEVVAPGT